MAGYDYIIVGAGSAGCVLARRLSDDPAINVLLLEAGPRDNSLFIHMPAGCAAIFSRRNKFNWYYETEGQKHLKDRRILWPRGKVLGGSSSINGMVYMRGHPRDFDDWRQLGNPGWSYAEVLPYFKRAENFEEGGNAYHGSGGPLHVAPPKSTNVLPRVLIEAGLQAGYPRTEDFNGLAQEGFGPIHLNIKNGKRASAATSYLTPVLGRPNLKVETGAQATRILFEQGRAAGIEFAKGRDRRTVWAGREIILAGGVINSPQLLMLSGIGPAETLGRFGIRPRIDLKGVGANLQDHLDCSVIYEINQPITYYSYTRGARMIGVALNYLLLNKGPGREQGLESGGFVRSRPDLEVPDLQIQMYNVIVEDHFRKPADRDGVTGHVCVLRPESRGHVTLRSADPLDAPLIQPNYLSSDNDLRALRAGVRIMRDIFAQSAFDPYRGPELAPGAPIQSDEKLDEWIRKTADTIYHPVGTCKMGTDDFAVVDEKLRVRGVEGLRVVDASIMPTLVGGNTNAATIMIAEKASDLILGVPAMAPEEVEIAGPRPRTQAAE